MHWQESFYHLEDSIFGACIPGLVFKCDFGCHIALSLVTLTTKFALHTKQMPVCVTRQRAQHPQNLQEQEAFAKAASLDTHKALVHIFFAQRSTKKVKGVTDAGLKARKVRKVAVIGGGLMGSGIATAGLLAGQEVLIKEVNDKFLQVYIG